jgi:hypothetical protein
LQFSITKDYCSKLFQFLHKQTLKNLTAVRVFNRGSVLSSEDSLQLAQAEISIRLKEEFPQLLNLLLPVTEIYSPESSDRRLSLLRESSRLFNKELRDWIWERTVNCRKYKEKFLLESWISKVDRKNNQNLFENCHISVGLLLIS